MASDEEFDYLSDDENFGNDWKFDENDDFSKYLSFSDAPLDADTSKEVVSLRKATIIGAENNSNEQELPKVSRMDLNTAKAGMDGLDKDKINQIIHEASKGSKFYENEKKKEKQVQKRIEELQKKMASFTNEQKVKAQQTADKIVQKLEHERDLSRTIVHVDMDAYYAAVEMRDDPSLKSKPMAVGDNAMLCTSNYLARRYGVRAGMPGFIGKKLCPNLTIVPTNFEKYTKISHEIREVLAEYDQNFFPMSLDEAYLDITDYLRSNEGQKTRKAEVKEEESKNIEGKPDTGTIKENVCAETKYKTERENATDEKFVVVQQETSKIEALPKHAFEEVTKQVKVEKTFDDDVTKYEQDEKNSEGAHEPNITEIPEIKSEGIKLDAIALKADIAAETAKQKHNESSFSQQQRDGMMTVGQPEPQWENDWDFGHGLSENESDTSFLHEEPAAVEQEMFYNKVEEVVKEMRRKIEVKTQLTASAGIAPNMFLAKVCSDKNKPNGQFYLKPERDKIMDFVRELPLRKAFGIGRVSEQVLTSVLKANTCSELYDQRHLMQLLFTPNACRNYLEISLGLGSNVVDVDRERKSMSTETTFKEINKPEEHFAKCHELCQELSESLKVHGLTARKIGIKLKTVHFKVKTRVITALFPVQRTEEIFSHAKKLLINEIRSCSPEPLRLRLMGVRAAEFCEKGMVNESKQPTIISLMKKSGSVRERSVNLNSSSTPCASEQEVSSEHASTSREDEVRHSETCSGLIVLDDHPSTSNQHTNLPSDQLGCHNSHGNDQDLIKMIRSSPDKHDVSNQEPTTFNCPVCGKDLIFTSGNALLQMNRHIDMCLRKQQAVPGDSGQQTNKAKETSKKRKRESSNNTNKTVKRKPMDRFLTKHMK